MLKRCGQHAGLLIGCLLFTSMAHAATVAHEGFTNLPFVNDILTDGGHTPTVLTAAQVAGGSLLSGGNPAFDVFVISRNTTAFGASPGYVNGVQAYVAAGGNVVTEFSGHNMFFSSYAADIVPPSDHTPQLGIFQGAVHSGEGHGTGTPINILDTTHPTVQGISNPHVEGDGTEFFYWIENPDPALQIVADFVGNGTFGFPQDQNLPTLLVGCSDDSTFVFGTWDWNDTLHLAGGNRQFLLNSVDFAADPGSCEVCDPYPRTQGYWHRQCLGIEADDGGIDPGRNGRGPTTPTEPDFNPDLMACTEATLEDLGFLDVTTCNGMDADPPSDKCEKALKQLTALVLNVCSDRLQNVCEIDVSPEDGQSTNVGDLIQEVADLIHAGECKLAADLADAANEGVALVE